MTYQDRMREQKKYELSFEPKSIWSYEINIPLDKIVEDKFYEKTLKKTYSKDWIKTGAGGFLSKFNTENAKKVIEFWSKKGDEILDPFAGRTRGIISTLLKRNYIGYEVIKENIEFIEEQYEKLLKIYEMGSLKLINKSSEYIYI